MKQLLHGFVGIVTSTGESAPSSPSYPTWIGMGSAATPSAPSVPGNAAVAHVDACALDARVIGRTKPMTDAPRRPPETST